MFVLMSSRICLKLGHLGSKTRSPGQILLKMFVLMSSRICSKLGHLVSKTRSPGKISRKLCYNHFELWSECLPWSVLDKALKVLCCSGERYRAIMALLFYLTLLYTLIVSLRRLQISKVQISLCIHAFWRRWRLTRWILYIWKERQVLWENMVTRLIWIWALHIWSNLTILLLNTTCPVLANSIDPDQLASSEANWSGSALFVITYVNFYQKPGSSNLIGWKLRGGMAS